MKMPLILEKMMFGFIESQILFVCHEIKLFDYLSHQGPATLTQISRDLNLPLPSLERLLIGAHCIHLLAKDNEAYYLPTELAIFLSRGGEQYCGGKFAHYWQQSYKIFQHLLPALYENKPQWNKINQAQSSKEPCIYSDFIYQSCESTQEFLDTMWASGYQDSLNLCQQYAFSGYKHLVDLGGATGSFAIAALHNNPELTATIMDFPQVKIHAEKKFHEHQLQERIGFYSGDIFKDALPCGDIYVIGYLLSDWPANQCLDLIKRVYDSLPKNGLIIILEKLFSEDKSGPYLTAMLNLTMLLEMQGQHRSASEYFKWLKNVGYMDLKLIQSEGEKHMIFGVK